ncbi:MAG TPA: DUF1839 family protein [Thermoanaerobaculia bacterium]|jgi:hypothetical protein
MTAVLALDPQTYRCHTIHGAERIWAETNCYVDVWIELLHALGREPVAGLPFTLTIDFEGDQWTFFKFPLLELYDLFGVHVQELALWRPLHLHIEEQLRRGNPVLVEVDSFYLADTAGTAYKQSHVKTTVAVVEIDVERPMVAYFHNAGFFRAEGDDVVDLLGLRGERGPHWLPPYAEFAKVGEMPHRTSAELLQTSLALLRKHLGLVPRANPFTQFRERLAVDLPQLMEASLETFHLYSFATLRQYGACYELAATYLRWLAEQGQPELEEPTRAFSEISESAKAFQFQLARTMARRKPLDLAPLETMGERWERGIAALKARYG